MTLFVLQVVSLFFTGLLAGAELVMRYGIRGPLASLDQRPHILLRQALVRRLRILIPGILVPSVVSGIAVAVLGRAMVGAEFRWAAVLALATFLTVTLGGTVPINKSVPAWQPDAPPADWLEIVHRWERLNTVRCWALVTAFACLLTALAMQLPRLDVSGS